MAWQVACIKRESHLWQIHHEPLLCDNLAIHFHNRAGNEGLTGTTGSNPCLSHDLCGSVHSYSVQWFAENYQNKNPIRRIFAKGHTAPIFGLRTVQIRPIITKHMFFCFPRVLEKFPKQIAKSDKNIWEFTIDRERECTGVDAWHYVYLLQRKLLKNTSGTGHPMILSDHGWLCVCFQGRDPYVCIGVLWVSS